MQPVEVAQVWKPVNPPSRYPGATRNGRTDLSAYSVRAAKNSAALDPHSLAQSQSVQAQ